MSAPSYPWIIPGFDHIGAGQTTQYLVGGGSFDTVTVGGNVSFVTRDGIRMLRCGPNSGFPTARLTIPSTTTIVLGFLSRFNSGGISTPWIGFYSAGTEEMTLRATAAGLLQLSRNGTSIETDSTHNYVDGVLRFIEFAYVVGNAPNGRYEVRVDGVTVMSATGVDTTTTGNPVDQFRMQGGNTFASGEGVEATWLYFKEWEDASTPGFRGRTEWHLTNPNADVAVQFTPTPGTGEENREDVDETPVDDDTTYVETSNLGDVDQYSREAAPAGIQAVWAVVRGTIGKAPAGGSPNIEHGLKIGTDEAYGSAKALGANYGQALTPFFTQPNGSAWTPTAADAANSLDRSA